VPIAATDEQLALQGSIRDWAKQAGPLALVRSLEPGPDAGGADVSDPGWGGPSWDGLAGLGVFSIALPAAAGGAGGTVTDLAAALEELTLTLAPGPVLPTLLAGLVLAPHPDLPVVPPLLSALAAGKTTATVGLPAATLTGAWQPAGQLRVTGEIGPVLSGGASGQLLAAAVTGDREVWFCIPADHPGITVTERTPVDFSRPLATIRFTGTVIAPGQILAGVSTARVRALAATLYAVEAAAVASWCSVSAAEYARTRHQFGRPIGSFQAVKHLCAGLLCRAERAAALAWDAARAADEAPQEHPLAAAAAAALALDAAVDNAKDCIQVLGGIGFTWEHDAHLYLRRALALRQLLGGGAAWRERTAALALAGSRRRLALTAPGLPLTGAARVVAGTVAALPPEHRRAALADAGYAAPQWPPPYGLGASPGEVSVIDEELDRAGLTRPDLVIGGWAGLAVVQHGSPAQQERFAGPTLRGEITWCQLFSEPGAGSDLASLQTRARRVAGAGTQGTCEAEPGRPEEGTSDAEPGRRVGESNEAGRRVAGGGWRLAGQKVWTSLAREADWAICLARTDPAGPRHRGLTFFLVDMRSDGIEIRPLREITGRAVFNEVFLDEVFVPDDCVLGEPGDGWRIARSALATERVAMGRGSALGDEVEGLITRVRSAGLSTDPRVMEQLGALIAEGLAGSVLDLRSALAQLRGAGARPGPGADPGQLAAVRKLLGVAHRQSVAEAALALCGPEGAAADGAGSGPVHEFLLSRCLSIAGGTTQVLLSVVAERVLGLPREEMR
jgi:alkylation response protein AidB-like acyl-CoA dehydrogenase